MNRCDALAGACSVHPRVGRGRVTAYPILMPVVIASLFAPGCSQARFATPDQAVQAFVSAVRSQNLAEVRRILGRGSEELISSGDEVADQRTRETFLAAYDEKYALVREPDASVTLEVGPDDWPMPIPIVEHRGSWRFDTLRGKEEVLNRRVGRNELTVVQVCLALVDAQREYMETDHDGDGTRAYAQKFISDSGEQNGLYWETGADEPPSPLGPLVADAVAEGYGTERAEDRNPRPFHGYYFKLLKSQGPSAPGGARDYLVNGRMTEGFAVVAWPAEYGNSGVTTFLVSHQGVVYERDLGPHTERIANGMSVFDPDSQWRLVP